MGEISEAITYFGITTTIALLVACAVVIYERKLFSQEPGLVYKSLLDFSLLTIYFLFIPVLFNFALNGWKAIWALPEFNSVMFGFINTLQILFMSVLGIGLAGLITLITFIRRKLINK